MFIINSTKRTNMDKQNKKIELETKTIMSIGIDNQNRLTYAFEFESLIDDTTTLRSLHSILDELKTYVLDAIIGEENDEEDLDEK